MGLTWYAFNHTKKLVLDPINGWKAWEIIANCPGMCEVLAHLMMNSWKGDYVTFEHDPYDGLDPRLEKYENITEWAISSYNDEFIEPWVRAVLFSSNEGYARSWERHFILDGMWHPKSIDLFMDNMDIYTQTFLERYFAIDGQK